MSPEYQEFLKTDIWKATAHSVYCKAGGQCERCGTAEGTFNAHHLSYIAPNRDDAPSWVRNGFLPSYDWLVCLCEDCHRLFHKKGILYRTREGCKIIQGRRRGPKRRLIVLEVPYNDEWLICNGKFVV